jgi:hypothetical protein
MESIINKNEINLYSVESEVHNSCIERFNRTLREKLEKQETYCNLEGKEYIWQNELPDILDKYLNTVHSTINMKPVDAIKLENQDKLTKTWNNIRENKRIKHENEVALFKKNDLIRITRYKKLFEKGV